MNIGAVVLLLGIGCCLAVSDSEFDATTRVLRSATELVRRHVANIKRDVQTSHQGPPPVILKLLAKGCDRSLDLSLAIHGVLDSPIWTHPEVQAALAQSGVSVPDKNLSYEHVAMISCIMTNVESIEDVAAIMGAKVEDTQFLFSIYVTLYDAILELLRGEQDKMDPIQDAETIEALSSIFHFDEVLKRDTKLLELVAMDTDNNP